jgi:tetratricopeptide (TPR) repeat protein
LLRSAITAAAGDLEGASRSAEEAADAALQLGFGRVAADGLRTLGTTLMFLNHDEIARAKLDSSIDVARRAGSNVAVALGQLQLASLYSKLGKPRDALNFARGVLGFLRWGQYRRYELLTLTILARAHADLNEYDDANRLAREVLSTAESLRDEFEVANALENLADLATSAGSLPEALALREREEASHHRQQDTRFLAFDLTQRAELLIRLGRFADAEGPLGEIEAGAKAANQSFVLRRPKASQLRALMAAERGEFAAAQRFAGEAVAAITDPKPNTTRYQAAALLACAEVRLGRSDTTAVGDPPPGLGSRSFQSEFRYWRASAFLGSGQIASALRESNVELTGIAVAPSDEYEWRMAAIGAEAARRIGDAAQAGSLQARSRAALQRVRVAWKGDAVPYERRADVLERKHAIGIE